MKEIRLLEKELSEFDFINLYRYTNTPVYDLTKNAKGALYSAYNLFEESQMDLPIIYTQGLFQIIIEQGVDSRLYTLQYVIR